MAAQLFSRRTAQAVKYLLHKDREASFIELVNDIFDVLNSRYPQDQKAPLRSGYGFNVRSQENSLKRFLEICADMRVGKRNSLLPFQKGFLTSINSLFGLYTDMKNAGASYILTAKLNQDCLENFFSRIRGFGVFYNNPTPFEVKNRIRLLILTGSANKIPLSLGASIVEDKNENEHSASAEPADETVEEFENFLSSDLCIKVTNESVDTTGEEDLLLDSELSDSACSSEDVTDDALKYLAGYIAFKCRNIDSNLGSTPTAGKCHLDTELSAKQDWITIISKGGLTSPSPAWLSTICQLEIIFAAFHGPNISRCNRVMGTLTDLIHSKFPELNKKIVQLYVRTRTFIRIRHLNKTAKSDAMRRTSAKRNRLWVASSSATSS